MRIRMGSQARRPDTSTGTKRARVGHTAHVHARDEDQVVVVVYRECEGGDRRG